MKRIITFLPFFLLTSTGLVYAQMGQAVDLSFTFDGNIRTYQVYVPANYDGSEPWPLVLNLHGFGSNTGLQTFTSQLNEVADTAGFLIAYPQGLNTAAPDGSEGTGWNTDWWTGRNDVGALNRLIDHAWTNFEIDLAKVYATGLDNGGQMSLALSCVLNDRIAAAAGVAVPFTPQQLDSCSFDNPVPTLLMHGTADVLTPFAGIPGFVLGAMDLAAGVAAKNSCDDISTDSNLPDTNTTDSSTVILKVFENCDMGAEVRLYEVTNGGHTWSDGPPAPPGFEILGNVNRDVSSSVEMWHFFQRFSHPNPRAGTTIEASGNSGLLDRSLMVAGTERTYKLYVPANYNETEPWPLVINLHGFAASSIDQLTVSDMLPVADTAGFLIAYPQGFIRESLGDTGPGWNAGRSPDLVDDVAFISSLIDQVFQEFGIDLARVYATGLSQGGAMTYLLGSDLEDRIAAIATVAATMQNDLQYAPTRPVPVLLINGTADGLGPYVGSDVLPLTSVATTLQFWREHNECTVDSTVTELPDVDNMDNSTVTLLAYSNCAAGTEILHYRINGGGHTWPGGPPAPAFFGPTNQDFHASSAIWNFFNRHQHPNPRRLPQLLDKTVTVDTLEREYLLYIPATYDGSSPWSLVFNLHGAGGNGREQAFISGMNTVADTAGFLVAYPVGISNEAGNLSGWNEVFAPGLQNDVEFISTLIDTIAGDFSVDLTRVYSAGLSNGGGMSFTLACSLSNRIAAIASVAAPGLLSDCNPGRAVPILYMHGTADVIVPFAGGNSPVTPSVFPAARDRLQFWLNNNVCAAVPVITELEDVDLADSSSVTLEQYTGCDEFSELWFYEIDNGGHTWPGGPPVPPGFEILGNVNRDINASSEIWNFFDRHQLMVSNRTVSPTQFQLKVYPNPFSNELNFEFELPEAANVQLDLYNLLGQKVVRLANQNMEHGTNRIRWLSEAEALPKGLYYYRLQIGNSLVSQPVILK